MPAPSGAAWDWEALVRAAEREGVSAVLFHGLRAQGLGDRVPAPAWEALSQAYHANLRRNLLILTGLRPVLAALHSAGLPCIVLKGAALAELVYPHPALRGMGDVDLLVRKGDLLAADRVLAGAGLLPRDGLALQALENPVGYLASLEYRADPPAPLNLHLHWHLVNSSVPAAGFIGQIDLVRLWEKSEAVRIADSEARTLCPEHLILSLCEHALRVGHSFDRLILLCDLFFAMTALADRLDWEAVAQEGRRTGLSRFAYHGLTLVRHYTGLPIPEACLAGLRPANLSPGERLFQHLQRRRRVRGSSYLLYLAMHRGLAAKAGLIGRTLFPPLRILRQRRQGYEALPFRYAARFGEVLSHLSMSLRMPAWDRRLEDKKNRADQ